MHIFCKCLNNIQFKKFFFWYKLHYSTKVQSKPLFFRRFSPYKCNHSWKLTVRNSLLCDEQLQQLFNVARTLLNSLKKSYRYFSQKSPHCAVQASSKPKNIFHISDLLQVISQESLAGTPFIFTLTKNLFSLTPSSCRFCRLSSQEEARIDYARAIFFLHPAGQNEKRPSYLFPSEPSGKRNPTPNECR